MTLDQQHNFERAFSGGIGSCRLQCHCGKVYFHDSDDYDWEDGEVEELRESPDARGLDYTVGLVVLEGKEYVNACTCWHDRASKIIQWLEENRTPIVDFFKREKARQIREATGLATLEE